MMMQLTVDATLSQWPLLQCHKEPSQSCSPNGCLHALRFARCCYSGASVKEYQSCAIQDHCAGIQYLQQSHVGNVFSRLWTLRTIVMEARCIRNRVESLKKISAHALGACPQSAASMRLLYSLFCLTPGRWCNRSLFLNSCTVGVPLMPAASAISGSSSVSISTRCTCHPRTSQ